MHRHDAFRVALCAVLYLGASQVLRAQGDFVAPQYITDGTYVHTLIDNGVQDGSLGWNWSWDNPMSPGLRRIYHPESYGTVFCDYNITTWINGWGPGSHSGDVMGLPSGWSVYEGEPGWSPPTNSVGVYPITNGGWQVVISNGVSAGVGQLVILLSNAAPAWVGEDGATLLSVMRMTAAALGASDATSEDSENPGVPAAMVIELRRMIVAQRDTIEAVDDLAIPIRDAGQLVSRTVNSNYWFELDRGMVSPSSWQAGFSIAQTLDHQAAFDLERGWNSYSTLGGSKVDANLALIGTGNDTLEAILYKLDNLTFQAEVNANIDDFTVTANIDPGEDSGENADIDVSAYMPDALPSDSEAAEKEDAVMLKAESLLSDANESMPDAEVGSSDSWASSLIQWTGIGSIGDIEQSRTLLIATLPVDLFKGHGGGTSGDEPLRMEIGAAEDAAWPGIVRAFMLAMMLCGDVVVGIFVLRSAFAGK